MHPPSGLVVAVDPVFVVHGDVFIPGLGHGLFEIRPIVRVGQLAQAGHACQACGRVFAKHVRGPFADEGEGAASVARRSELKDHARHMRGQFSQEVGLVALFLHLFEPGDVREGQNHAFDLAAQKGQDATLRCR